MSLSIRPYVSVAETISRTAPNLLKENMPTIIIGTAVDEKYGFISSLNFTVENNNATISAMLNLDENGKVFKVAGIRENSTVDSNTFRFGALELSSGVDFGDKELHVHVKSKDEKHILVLETGDNYVTEDDMLNMGVLAGDTINIDPPSDSDEPFGTTIRDFQKDGDDLLIYLWDEVTYDVDESNSLTAHIVKDFKDVTLDSNGFAFENVPSLGEDINIKGQGSFSFTYFVYQPTDVDVFFDNIKISLIPIANLVNTKTINVTAVPQEGVLVNWFTANRTDLANRIITVNYNNYQDVIGFPSEKNKLGTMLDLVASEVTGFELKVFVVENNGDDSYRKALDILSTSTKAYQVACLTDSDKVLTYLNGSIERGAEPKISAYKMGIFCPRTPMYSKKIEILDADITDNGDGTYTLTTATGGFAAVDVNIGDKVIGSQDLEIANSMYYDTISEPYSTKVVAIVDTVVTDKKIILRAAVSGVDVVGALDGQNPTIIKINSKEEVAELVEQKAKSFQNMHLGLLFPDKFLVEGKLMAGYYVAGLLAAIMGHLPPQQGLSNLSFKVVNRVFGSSFYYTDTELDDIAGAGIMVIAQNSHDSEPFIIRQLTTNTASLEEMEINKVRCLDYAALAVKGSVDGYIGKRNTTQRNASDVKENIDSLLKSIIRNTNNSLLGSIIKSYKINYIEIPENEIDAIIGDIEVVTPTSLNSIRLFVKSKN